MFSATLRLCRPAFWVRLEKEILRNIAFSTHNRKVCDQATPPPRHRPHPHPPPCRHIRAYTHLQAHACLSGICKSCPNAHSPASCRAIMMHHHPSLANDVAPTFTMYTKRLLFSIPFSPEELHGLVFAPSFRSQFPVAATQQDRRKPTC